MGEKEVISNLDSKVQKFLLDQTNLTLAVSQEGKPYCANCFYAFDLETNMLIFKSKISTTHIKK